MIYRSSQPQTTIGGNLPMGVSQISCSRRHGLIRPSLQEVGQTELNVSERTLDRLEAMLPESRVCALSAHPGNSFLPCRWRVHLPPAALDAWVERLDPEPEF